MTARSSKVRQAAGIAIANGLPWDAALAADRTAGPISLGCTFAAWTVAASALCLRRVGTRNVQQPIVQIALD